jgi:ADP-heptose:LPS heptosyltransferase
MNQPLLNKNARSLLIVHQGALGDFVATFPAIVLLNKSYNRVDVLCSSQLGKLARQLGLVQQWFPLESAGFASVYTEVVDEKIKQLLQAYATVILFSLSRQLEASVKKIRPGEIHRIPSIPPVDTNIHVTEFIFENLVTHGLLNKDQKDLDMSTLSQELGIRKTEPQYPRRILIHPGSGSARKRWPIVNFFRIEASLKRNGLEPEFVVGPAEERLAGEIAAVDRRLHVLDNLPDLVDLLKSAGGFIGNDCGASHLAAFLGLPTTVIFGPADPRRWQPIGRKVEVVRPGLECSPCFETEKANCSEPECLTWTSPEAVLEAFYQVYPNTS